MSEKDQPAESDPKDNDQQSRGSVHLKRKKRKPNPRTSIPARERRTQEPPQGVTR
jgi:hypothetical protein